MITNNTANTSTTPPAAGKVNVLLVDDSAVIRGALSRIIQKDPEIQIVGSVSNGELAVMSAKNNRPHVVILDIEMPVMDGLTALPKILEASPKTKVVMFSSLTEKGASVTMKALALGAVECIVKPTTTQSTDEGSEFQKTLLTTTKNLVSAEERATPMPSSPGPSPMSVMTTAVPLPPANRTPYKLYDDRLSYKGKPDLIAIGSSTGGPQALFELLKSFKNFDIPTIITQHMPATFTKILAQHIQQQTGVPAFEGQEGMEIEKGKIYVAQGGFHMRLAREGDKTIVHLDNGPQINFCKPAVDPMFMSALAIYGKKILGVMLTGMGSDGLDGTRALVQAGCRMIAQDEATSVVWGMPGAVAKAGLCSAVLPLQDMGPWVRQAVTGRSG